jgi:elongation factor 1-gamma
MSGTLYTYPENFRAYKALIAAEYSGFGLKVADNFVFGETNREPGFLKKFPLGKVPALETKDGVCLAESNAIAWFVANDQLRGGSDKVSQAQVLQWLAFADSEILPAACTWVYPVMGIMAHNKQNTDRAKESVKEAMGYLNTHLLTRTYLVGERLTLADIVVACTMLSLYEHVLDPSFRGPFQNVNRWFNTIIHQKKVKSVIGDFQLCTKMGEFDAKRFAEVQGKLGGDGDQAPAGKKDKKKEKKEDKKKEEKPKAAKEPEPAEEMDEAELALAAEPKAKDPFAAMPKGTFDMDDFKRFYSNEDEAKSVPYFWEKFDKENYSIWFCEYKYPNELTQVFMSCNLITGMFQRLDKMRKHAFGSMCLFGENNNSTISGVWFWRGQDLAFELSPDWQVDYEVYDWKKLDANAEETKNLVKQYLCWEGTDKGGRKFNQGKIFK